MAKRIIDMRTISRVPSQLARFQEIFMQEAYRQLGDVVPAAVSTMKTAVTNAPSTGVASNPVVRGRRSRKGGAPDLVQVNNGAVATGQYRDDWKAKRISYGGASYVLSRMSGGKRVAGGVMGVLVYNTKVYAPRIEYGRAAGKMPPVKAIRKWLQVKFGLPYRRAGRIAWPIAAAIKKRGIPARKIMTSIQAESDFKVYLEVAGSTAQANALARAFR